MFLMVLGFYLGLFMVINTFKKPNLMKMGFTLKLNYLYIASICLWWFQ